MSGTTVTLIGGVLAAIGGLIAAGGAYYAAGQRAASEQARVERTLAFITGGDSYATLNAINEYEPDPPGLAVAPSDTWHTALMAYGEYPLYDVRVELVDDTKQMHIAQQEVARRRQLRGPETFNRDVFASPRMFGPDTSQVWNVGNVTRTAGPLQFLGPLTLPSDAKTQVYLWTITARNAPTFGEWHFARVGSVWRCASRAVRNRQIIPGTTSVPDDFPAAKSGRVDWRGHGVRFVPGQHIAR
jgi:hypothetical protein